MEFEIWPQVRSPFCYAKYYPLIQRIIISKTRVTKDVYCTMTSLLHWPFLLHIKLMKPRTRREKVLTVRHPQCYQKSAVGSTNFRRIKRFGIDRLSLSKGFVFLWSSLIKASVNIILLASCWNFVEAYEQVFTILEFLQFTLSPWLFACLVC